MQKIAIKKCGDITFKEDINGNIVEGTYKGQPSCVKKVVISSSTSALLKKIDGCPNPNLQRLFHYLADPRYYIVAFEECHWTLKSFIKSVKQKKSKIIPLLYDMTKGLNFLHNNGILHKNINPDNIFVDLNGNTSKLCNIQLDEDSQNKTYKSAELLDRTSSETKESDIFALGCTFYYALSKGVHPFKNVTRYSDDGVIENIKEGISVTSKVLHFDEEYKKYCVTDLIKQMINKDFKKRPCCNFILKNIVFSDKYKIFRFIKACHLDESDIKCFSLVSSENIIGKDWTSEIKLSISTEESNDENKKNVRTFITTMAKIVKFYEPTLEERFKEEHIDFWLSRFPKIASFIFNSLVKPTTRVRKKFDEFLPPVSECGHLCEDFGLLKLIRTSNIDVKWVLHREDIEFNPINENLLNAVPTIKGKSHNSINRVFSGYYKSTPVAIKEIEQSKLKHDQGEIKNIIQLMSGSSGYDLKGKENIIQFLGCFEDETNDIYYYLVFEKAITNLKEYVFDTTNRFDELKKEIDIKKILKDISEAVHYIHYHDIVHFDIKLENILLVRREGQILACICDFGSSDICNKEGLVPYSKKIEGTEVHATRKMRIARKYNNKVSKSDDILHLGKVFSYTLIKKLRDKYKNDIPPILSRHVAQYCPTHITYTVKYFLITLLEEDNKITSDDVRKHPYFWTNEQKIKFLEKVDALRGHYEKLGDGRTIIEKAKEKLFQQTDWREFKALNSEESAKAYEILEDYKKEIDDEIDENNIFDLVRFIVNQVKVKQNNTAEYWTDIFDGIFVFLHKELENVLNGETEFYSGTTPKLKDFTNKRRSLKDQREIYKKKRKVCFNDESKENESNKDNGH